MKYIIEEIIDIYFLKTFNIQVLNINPKTGKLLRSIKFNDAKNITSVAFGGPNLDILYVTSASMGLNENQLKEQPHAGYLFAIKGLGVHGFPSNNVKVPN